MKQSLLRLLTCTLILAILIGCDSPAPKNSNSKDKDKDKANATKSTMGTDAPKDATQVANNGEGAKSGKNPLSQDEAANFPFQDLKGNSYNLSKLKGKVVLIVYWATWCGPCKREIPGLNEIHEKYSPKGLQILAVSQDDSEDLVTEFLKEDAVGKTIKYPIIYGDPYVKLFGRMSAIPTLVLIDKEGNVVGKQEGSIPAEAIAKVLDEYI